MKKSHIPVLAELLNTYYTETELLEVAELFDIPVPSEGITAIGLSRRLIENVDFGKHGLMLEAILEQAAIRNEKALTDPDPRQYSIHFGLRDKIREIRTVLEESETPREIAVSEDKPFSAKSEVRELLAKAETDVLVVDKFVGVMTLDCFRSLTVPIRLLTGTHPDSVESGFDRALHALCSEGFRIEVRQHQKLHDRHIVFNDRCWLVGSSLKDAGRKAFHVMEIVDAKSEVVASLEAKWQKATAFPPQTEPTGDVPKT